MAGVLAGRPHEPRRGGPASATGGYGFVGEGPLLGLPPLVAAGAVLAGVGADVVDHAAVFSAWHRGPSRAAPGKKPGGRPSRGALGSLAEPDRKSTRLNSSHGYISY